MMFPKVLIVLGMFFHQLISGPTIGLAVIILFLEILGKFRNNSEWGRILYKSFYVIFFFSVISGLCLDLGLQKYWDVSLLLELFNHPNGRSSLLGFIIINLTFLLFLID